MSTWDTLVRDLAAGSTRALARLITRVENREPGWMDALQSLHPLAGTARVLGITGSPGAGKSTLTGRIAHALAEAGHRVGVIAVDPTSPFSGGAVLGDRLRMGPAGAHERVFLRSMATRGALGGLCLAAKDAVKLMGAAGMDFVLIETVGVGQDEVEVIRAADVVVVVCVPGQGDGVQAIKAGIMEIADLFVVNKADREGADQVAADLRAMLDLGPAGPRPPVLQCVATAGEGLPDVLTAILDLLDRPPKGTEWREARLREEVLGLLHEGVWKALRSRWAGDAKFDEALRQVLAGGRNPYSVAQEILEPLSALLEARPAAPAGGRGPAGHAA